MHGEPSIRHLIIFAAFCYSFMHMTCISVSRLNELARESLQACFDPDVWVQGEIHGLKYHAKSGHLYFDLVEKAKTGLDGYVAKISCAFFRGPYTKWRTGLASMGIGAFELNSGIEVKLKARIDLFVKEGRYQLIVSEIDPSFTFGAIARKREQTIRELRALGIFDRNKSLPFPELPLNIGLITSEGSAAFSDFMSIVRAGGYCFSITLFDAHMQGENTVPEILKGMRILQKHPDVDTIVIIRGGGAKTDLFSFDDPALCKAIALCPKPVITGIGHEIDVSVADLVAHSYGVTPTDVAGLYVSKADEVWAFLDEACREISFCCHDIWQKMGERLRRSAASLEHVSQRWMVSALSGLKDAAFRLHTAVAGDLAKEGQSVSRSVYSLGSFANAALIEHSRALDGLPVGLARDARACIQSSRQEIHRLHHSAGDHAHALFEKSLDRMIHLETYVSLMDPAEILKRGYSITLNESGRAVIDAGEVEEGDCIITRLSKGTLKSVVKDKES